MNRKTLAIVGILLVLLLSATGCAENQSPDKISDIETEMGLSALISLADGHISSCQHALEILANTGKVQSADWSQMSTLLGEVESGLVPSTIWFVLPNGAYYTVSLGLTGSNLSDRAYFPKLMAGNKVLGDLVVSKSTGRKSLIAAVPVMRDGVVVGGLGISIFLDSLSSLLASEMKLPDGMSFYAVDSSMEVALHSDAAMILQTNPELSTDVISGTSDLTGWRFSLDRATEIDAEIGLSALINLADGHIYNCRRSLDVLATTSRVQSAAWTQMSSLIGDVESALIPSTVWFVLPDGSYYTVQAGLTDKNLSDRAYFPGLMAGSKIFGDLVVSKSTGKKSVIAAVPVMRDGTIVGGLGASISLDSLSTLLAEQIGLPGDMVFYAVDSKGEVALHSDTAMIMKDNPELSGKVISGNSNLSGWSFYLGFK